MMTIPLGRNAVYGTLQVDTDRLPAHISAYVFEYGLRQVLNDAMAEKKDEDGRPLPDDQIVAKAEKRLDALYAGTIRSRGVGEPAVRDPVEAEVRRLAVAQLDKRFAALGEYAGRPVKGRLVAVWNARQRATCATVGEVVAEYLARLTDGGAKLRAMAARIVAESAVEDVEV